MTTHGKDEFQHGNIPPRPGVYIYRDRFGEVIYIGKAANLRRRMSQYFQPSRRQTADPKTRSLLNSIWTWEFHEVKNTDEALILESRLIKDYAPRYNVLMRDDKRYFLLKINQHETYPRLILARLRKDDGADYYGPFTSGTALRAAVEFLNRHFGLRVCRTPVPDENDHRHCLASVIRDCSAPCVGRETPEGYRQRVEAVMKVFSGELTPLIEELKSRMRKAAETKRFEQAAKWRDVINVLEEAFGTRNRSFRFASIPSASGEEAVKDLQDALKISISPRLVEAFDISNLGGTMAVASMVCFVDGRPARERYRRFRIRTVEGSDDFAMMKEVVSRCYRRRLDEQRPLPDLIMIDGGKGQLSSAIAALVEMGCPPLPVIGLAKKHEEIFVPGHAEPILLDHSRPALRLLQAVRDEAHRFAVGYHRALRQKLIQESLLDEITGIGSTRKKSLLKEFGSLRELRKATAEEIAKRVPGIGLNFAEVIHAYLNKE